MNYDRIPHIYAEALHVLSEIYNACGNGGSAFIEAIRLLKMDLDVSYLIDDKWIPTHRLFQLLRGQVDIHIHNMADEEIDESELPDLVDWVVVYYCNGHIHAMMMGIQLFCEICNTMFEILE